MRIQVECRDGGDARAFYLATHRLPIMRVLERVAEPPRHRFRVKVADGRVFVLSHDIETGEWQLQGVNTHRPLSRA